MGDSIARVFGVLGLSDVAVRVYLALISLGGKGGIKDIISESGLSRSQVYRGLKELINSSLVYPTAEKPKSYVVVPPREILRDLIEERIRELRELADRVSIIAERLVPPGPRGETIYSPVDGLDNVVRLIHYVVGAARKELLLFIPARLVDRYLVDLSEAKRRGVYVDLTLSGAFREDLRGVKGEVADYVSVIRVRPFGSRVLAVADSNITLLSPVPGGREAGHVRGLLAEDVELGFILASYYHSRIASSSMTLRRFLEEGISYEFTNLGTALDFMQEAMKAGYGVEAEVRGVDNISRKEVVLKGLVHSVVLKPYKGIYAFLLNTGPNLVSIGGYRSFAEEISAKEIRVRLSRIGALTQVPEAPEFFK